MHARTCRRLRAKDALDDCDADARQLIAEYEKAQKTAARAAASGAEDADERVSCWLATSA